MILFRRLPLASFNLVLAGALMSALLVDMYFWPDASFFILRGTALSAYAGADFIDMWMGARLALAGNVAHLYVPGGMDAALDAHFGFDFPTHTWSYPPHYLLLLLPFGLLPYGYALALETGLTFALYVAAALPRRGEGLRGPVLVGLLYAPATILNTFSGQNGFLTAALLLGGMRALDARRPVVAGVLFGLLTVKPQLGLALPVVLIALQQWRAIASAVVTTLVLCLVATCAFGWQAWTGFFTVTLDTQMSLLETMNGFYAAMMPTPYAAARLIGMPNTGAAALQAAWTVVACLLCAVAVRRTADPTLRTALVAVTAMLASPYLFNYDMTAVSAAILVWVVSRRQPVAWPLMPVMALVWLTPALVMLVDMRVLPWAPAGLAALLCGLAAYAFGGAHAADMFRRVTTRLPRLVYLVALVAGAGLATALVMSFFWPDADFYIRRDGQISAYAGADFVNMWLGARLALEGHAADLFDKAAYARHLAEAFSPDFPFHFWSYPPHMLALALPLGLLPYLPALAIWKVGSLSAFVWSVWPRGVDRFGAGVDKGLLIIGLCLAPASIINAFGGQNGFLTAALMIGGLRLMPRRPLVAGMLFGLLTLKPHLGLVLPFVLLALGAWRTIAAAVVTTLAMAALSVLLFGIAPWQGFFSVTAAIQTGLLVDMHGFYVAMMPSLFAALRLCGVTATVAAASQAVLAVGICLATAWAVRRNRDPLLILALVTVATVLASPYSFNYDMTAMSAALLLLVLGRPHLSARWAALLAAAWIVPALVMIANPAGWPVAPLVLMALFGGLMVMAFLRPQAAAMPALPAPA